MSLLRAVATVGGFTMLSRITGLMREMLIAHFMGAGMVADAFFVAFRFPNLFRSLFAEGAFNAAFIPLFTGKLTAEGKDAAQSFAQQAMAVMAVLLTVLVVLVELGMPWAIYGLAPGFDDVPGKIPLAIELSRICFPYLLFISLTSLQAGVLNSMGRFAAAAGTPILLNVVAMAGLWGLAPYTASPGHALAWGTFAAGISQFAWLVFSVRKAGFALPLVRPRLTADVRLLLKRIVPGAVGAGVYQVNLVINTMIASTVANGAVSYLNYADRVNQLPLGVVGIAIGTALLPLLSRQLKSGDHDGAIESQNRAMELALLTTLPAAAALLTLAAPIIQVLFERGHFGPQETAATAQALMAFAIGLPAYVLVKVLTPGFFAREDTRTPVRIAIATMALNVVLNLALVSSLAHVGMALSTAIAAWFNVVLLAWRLHGCGFFQLDRRLLNRAPRILAAAALMGAGLWYGRTLIWPQINGFMAALAGLSLLVIAGLALYGAAGLLFRAARPSDLRSMLRRRSTAQ